MNPNQPFSKQDFDLAHAEWGANCGPAALAFGCQLHINDVRGAIPDFEYKHYTAPNMMREALEKLGRQFTPVQRVSKDLMATDPSISIVRIQWGGPWMKPDANPKWRYWYTHWIAAGLWTVDLDPVDSGPPSYTIDYVQSVFDCNGGRRSLASWEREIVPELTTLKDKRCDGAWFPTHIWRIL